VGTTLVAAPGSGTYAHTNAATQERNVITFAVTRDAAARIALANSAGGGVSGGIYLALEAPGNVVTPTPAITGANLIPSGSVSAPTGSNPVSVGTTVEGYSSTSKRNESTP